jgi:hypothetical protein
MDKKVAYVNENVEENDDIVKQNSLKDNNKDSFILRSIVPVWNDEIDTKINPDTSPCFYSPSSTGNNLYFFPHFCFHLLIDVILNDPINFSLKKILEDPWMKNKNREIENIATINKIPQCNNIHWWRRVVQHQVFLVLLFVLYLFLGFRLSSSLHNYMFGIFGRKNKKKEEISKRKRY